jgi:hypothetical protein
MDFAARREVLKRGFDRELYSMSELLTVMGLRVVNVVMWHYGRVASDLENLKNTSIFICIFNPASQHPSLPMSPTPLEILKQGLRSVSQKIKQRRDKLEAKLKQCEALSPADENWLDSEANVVDE